VDDVRYRDARPADAEEVASLHADSWRRHYRGAYTDTFLDRDVFADRLQVWTPRLVEPVDDAQTIVAEVGRQLAGFAHTVLDADTRWGALLDNLHVEARYQRRGIGGALIARAASFVHERRPGGALYLWVLEQNDAAQRFYQALGGTPKDAGPVPPVNGVAGRLNGTPIAIRYVWPDPRTLCAAS
jgi:ribosomal protein S18 acetylase RimI-like enzyme